MIALRFSKRGDMGMLEMFMIIFVLFIILGMGMYYFYKFSLTSVKDTAAETCMKTSSGQLSSILGMPEIICSIQGHSQPCVDVTKIMAFRNSTSVKALSRGICRKSITFVQAYPVMDGKAKDIECDEANFRAPDYPDNCGRWTVYEPDAATKKLKGAVLETPVSLYFPTLDEYRIGKLQLRMHLQP